MTFDRMAAFGMIQKARRDQPRNQQLLEVCSAFEECLVLTGAGDPYVPKERAGPKTRAEIQRDYRARKKGERGAFEIEYQRDQRRITREVVANGIELAGRVAQEGTIGPKVEQRLKAVSAGSIPVPAAFDERLAKAREIMDRLTKAKVDTQDVSEDDLKPF